MDTAFDALPADLRADAAFDDIVAGLALTADERAVPEKNRVTVLLDLPHVNYPALTNGA